MLCYLLGQRCIDTCVRRDSECVPIGERCLQEGCGRTEKLMNSVLLSLAPPRLNPVKDVVEKVLQGRERRGGTGRERFDITRVLRPRDRRQLVLDRYIGELLRDKVGGGDGDGGVGGSVDEEGGRGGGSDVGGGAHVFSHPRESAIE